MAPPPPPERPRRRPGPRQGGGRDERRAGTPRGGPARGQGDERGRRPRPARRDDGAAQPGERRTERARGGDPDRPPRGGARRPDSANAGGERDGQPRPAGRDGEGDRRQPRRAGGRDGEGRGERRGDRGAGGRDGEGRGERRPDRGARGRDGEGRGERRGDRGAGGRDRDRPQRGDRDRRPKPARKAAKEPPKTWGGVARRGSRNLQEPPPGSAAHAWRDAVARARGEEEREAGRGDPGAEVEPWQPETWIEEPDDAPPARPAGPRPAKRARRRPAARLPDDVQSELASAGGPRRLERFQTLLAEAASAYERDRYRDALKLLRPLADGAPDAAAVRELLGLTLYRLGRWNAAVKELRAFHDLTGSYDQHPTLADCYRGLKRYRKLGEVWAELRDASPSAELVAEGRLVVAGSLADRGQLGDAIEMLEATPGIHRSARAQEHHLRLWYALADLYERAGELPRARELFRRVADRDRDLYDAGDRLANLS